MGQGMGKGVVRVAGEAVLFVMYILDYNTSFPWFFCIQIITPLPILHIYKNLKIRDFSSSPL